MKMYKVVKPTTEDHILNYIKKYGSITSLECINNIGTLDLQHYIYVLRKNGEEILDIEEKGKNSSYKRYYLKGSEFEERLKQDYKNKLHSECFVGSKPTKKLYNKTFKKYKVPFVQWLYDMDTMNHIVNCEEDEVYQEIEEGEEY